MNPRARRLKELEVEVARLRSANELLSREIQVKDQIIGAHKMQLQRTSGAGPVATRQAAVSSSLQSVCERVIASNREKTDR